MSHTPDTERIRTHLTPVMIHLELYERRGGGVRHLEVMLSVLERAIAATEQELARAKAGAEVVAAAWA